MSSLQAEVCREHRDEYCKVCDEANDDLWVNPRDLPAPHEECPLCRQSVSNHEWNIQQHERAIAQAHEEISEIERGMQHTAYHESVRT